MIVLNWNGQGLTRRYAKRTSHYLVRKIKSDMVWSWIPSSMQTPLSHCNIFWVLNNYGGGYCLIWNASLNISILSISDSFLIYETTNPFELNVKVLLCCVYIPPYHSNKIKTWQNISNCLLSITKPWALVSDLNDITSQEEKQCGFHFYCNTKITLTSFMAQTWPIN